MQEPICVVPRPHYYPQPMRFGSRGPRKVLRPRQTRRSETFWLFTIYMANRSVYGLGKWYAKFRTGKFSSGIAFTICTDQFHLTENGREGLKLVSKMALRKWNTNFRLEYFVRKNRTTFADVPLLPKIFHWEDPKSRVPFTFEPDFPENSCKW